MPQQNFEEGLYVDYRYFDKNDIAPRFEFGYGLSYTTFEISNAVITPVRSKSALPAKRPLLVHCLRTTQPRFLTSMKSCSPRASDGSTSTSTPISTTSTTSSATRYPYPDGYLVAQPASGAGGDEGGNPDLWETYVTVRVDVKNTGAKAGSAVPQLYVGYPQGGGKVDFPVKVLRGFDKVYLEKGESKTVEFNVTRRDLSYWDIEHQNWVIETTGGPYTFMVGQSSRDLTAFGQW